MKKLTPLGVAAFAVLVAVVAIFGAPSPAQAYPEVQINLEVNRSVLYGGQDFTATGSSNGTTCAWTIEWNGDTRHGASSEGHPFSTTYVAPAVSTVTRIPLVGTCRYTAASARGTSTWSRTIEITVLPQTSAVSPPTAGGSNLPETGGPYALFLLGGVLLLASGAFAVFIARRRAEDAEIQAFRA